jgi:hypothetical protein
MLLRVKHRLLLLNILPAVGSFDTLRIVRDLQSALSFSEEEHKLLEITSDGEIIRWKEEADKPVDIPIGEKATDVIIAALKDLDSKRKLRAEFLPIYEHFVLDKEWEEDGGPVAPEVAGPPGG